MIIKITIIIIPVRYLPLSLASPARAKIIIRQTFCKLWVNSKICFFLWWFKAYIFRLILFSLLFCKKKKRTYKKAGEREREDEEKNLNLNANIFLCYWFLYFPFLIIRLYLTREHQYSLLWFLIMLFQRFLLLLFVNEYTEQQHQIYSRRYDLLNNKHFIYVVYFIL